MARRKMQTPQLFTFANPGIICRGFLTKKERQNIQGNDVGRYVIRGDDGLHVVNGTKNLDDGMAEVMQGEWVEIERMPDIHTATGMAMRQFDVYVGQEAEANAKK